jgi:hypothetical protein
MNGGLGPVIELVQYIPCSAVLQGMEPLSLIDLNFPQFQ